uniref:CRAL-TRIO domain-containing protein n=1 Tax=Globodera pallida TaxID=36090 RepID=A0A183BX23_GLOPA
MNIPTVYPMTITVMMRAMCYVTEQKKWSWKFFADKLTTKLILLLTPKAISKLVRFKRLKFGTKQFVDEATNQAPQIDDVSDENEAKNEFFVEFGAGGKATINGQTSTCSDFHVDRNFDLYNKYFNDQNEESTSGTHN